MSFLLSRSTTTPSVVNDVELSDPPQDSVSSLRWSPTADYLAVGSWDNNVRMYEVSQDGRTAGKAMFSHDAPVLSVCWSHTGDKVFSGGADKAGRMFDIATGQSRQVAAHDQPIRSVGWVEQHNLLMTGSWDKSVRFWDLRQQTPAFNIPLVERCYAMDAAQRLLVVGTADRHILAYDLQDPSKTLKTVVSPLKMQTRCIAVFPDGKGYAVGSVEGRLAMQYIESEKDNYSFRCHRKDGAANSKIPKGQSFIWPLNAISFHKQQGTFSTAGSDGSVSFWDGENRIRLKSFEDRGGPVVATDFSRTGDKFAYAVSYDWHQGHAANLPSVPNKVLIHAVKEEEVKKRRKS